MPNPFANLHSEKYIDLVTYRKSGAAVHTPVWFAEQDGRLYVMTRSSSGKAKRIRNNPEVEVAACNMRGRRTGAAVPAFANIIGHSQSARGLIRRKYLLARLPIWKRDNVYLEIRAAARNLEAR